MQTETAVFGGGCFWCTEAIFRELKGIIEVMPGYSGGTKADPTYQEVSSGTTGHAEVIKINFDSTIITYETLLTVFFATHDPTTQNRQGADIGPQYRSVVFYMSPEQKTAAETAIQQLNAASIQGAPIVTEVKPFDHFWPAEDYHQRYYEQHKDAPYCQIVINPKLEKLQQKFAALLNH